MTKIITTTTNTLEGWIINEYMQPVSANVVVGANIFSDISAALTDFFGGRSGSYERKLQEIYDQAILNLNNKAKALGANCVVGLKIDIGEISGKGNQMFMVSAVGTPVIATKLSTDYNNDNTARSKIIDGELVEKKIRARTIINHLLDGEPEIERVSEDSVSFIAESRLPEFSELVLAMLAKWAYYTESRDKLDKLIFYFANVDREVAIDSIYGYLASNTLSDEARERFAKTIFDFNLIDYSKLNVLLDGDTIGGKKTALDILNKGKSSYVQGDIDSLRRYADTIPQLFEPLGRVEQVKPMFSSSLKDVWVCTCNTQNGMDSTYCGKCGNDIHGFKHKDVKPNRVVEVIQERLEVIGNL